MHSSVVPALLLIATGAILASIRGKRLTTQIAVELVLVLSLATWLLRSGTSPFLESGDVAHRSDAAWLRTTAAVWWLVAGRLVVSCVAFMHGRDSHSREARLLSDLVSGAIYLVTLFIILNSIFELPVRGILATSGVAAIVLGLALQSTLSDLFSGIAVGIERSFYVGDLVAIGDEGEGVVVQMNWRSIHIRIAGDGITTIPNSVVAKSKVINYSKPTERRTATTNLHCRSDVSATRALELCRDALTLCPGILPAPPPSVAMDAILRHAMVAVVTYSVQNSASLATAKSELLQAFWQVEHLSADETMTTEAFLGRLDLFSTLDQERLEELAGAVEVRRLRAGERLFDAGTRGSTLYVVRSGVLDVVREEAGAVRSLGRTGPGAYVGDLSMMTGDERYVSVDALTPSVVIGIDKALILPLLAANVDLRELLERSVKRGIDLVENDVAAQIAAEGTPRIGLLAALLVRLSRRSGSA